MAIRSMVTQIFILPIHRAPRLQVPSPMYYLFVDAAQRRESPSASCFCAAKIIRFSLCKALFFEGYNSIYDTSDGF